MRSLQLRRHARRDPTADRLSPQGRAQAEDLGRSLAIPFDAVFVAPAERAAETMAWILRGMGTQLPPHDVVPGLGGRDGQGPDEMAEVVRAMLERLPDGGRGLAIGHTPLIERAVLGLIGREIEPLAECEGVLVTDDGGRILVDELRIG